MTDRDEKIQQLKDYFTKRADVVMAFLFGSQAKGDGATHAHSDWDIGVYFTPRTGELEYEDAETAYPAEDDMWIDLSRMLGTDDIDLIVLNRAPAHIAAAALRGVALAEKNRRIWLKFMLVVTGLAEDYRSFVKEYYAIFNRSHSLLPDDAERLQNIIGFAEEQNGLYDYFRKISHAEYTEDIHKRLEIERWVENIMNALIDIGKIALASSHRAAQQAYREIIAQAVFLFGLGEDTARPLEKWVRLRNVLAHEYLDIKWKRIVDFTSASEPYVRQYIDAAKQFLQDADVSQ